MLFHYEPVTSGAFEGWLQRARLCLIVAAHQVHAKHVLHDALRLGEDSLVRLQARRGEAIRGRRDAPESARAGSPNKASPHKRTTRPRPPAVRSVRADATPTRGEGVVVAAADGVGVSRTHDLAHALLLRLGELCIDGRLSDATPTHDGARRVADSALDCRRRIACGAHGGVGEVDRAQRTSQMPLAQQLDPLEQQRRGPQQRSRTSRKLSLIHI